MDRVDQRLHYFDPREETEKHHHVIPHWEQRAATYFVTFRLADSIPQAKLNQWKKERDAWLLWNPRPWTEALEQEYHQRFSKDFEHWLDQGYGSCLLRKPDLGQVVADALGFFEGVRSVRHASVVMPNHVHILFTPINSNALADVIHSWKSFTAVKINKMISVQGELWQRTYFDRMIRDGDHFRNCVRYIRRNPMKAGLKSGQFIHFESDWVQSLGI